MIKSGRSQRDVKSIHTVMAMVTVNTTLMSHDARVHRRACVYRILMSVYNMNVLAAKLNRNDSAVPLRVQVLLSHMAPRTVLVDRGITTSYHKQMCL